MGGWILYSPFNISASETATNKTPTKKTSQPSWILWCYRYASQGKMYHHVFFNLLFLQLKLFRSQISEEIPSSISNRNSRRFWDFSAWSPEVGHRQMLSRPQFGWLEKRPTNPMVLTNDRSDR